VRKQTIGFAIVVFVLALASASRANAQDLYEIQVYPYMTVPAGRTMVEVHSNYFARGTLDVGPEFPLNHQTFVTLARFSAASSTMPTPASTSIVSDSCAV